MLSYEIKNKLKKNWGDMADALECFAEVKFCLYEGMWECYVYALDPNDEDTMRCILKSPLQTNIEEWSLNHLYSMYDLNGEPPVIDKEYRRRQVKELVKRFINE